MACGIIKKNGKVIKYIFLTITLTLLLVALFSVSLTPAGEQKNGNYPNTLELISIDIKKKLMKFDVTGLVVKKVWEQKSVEDKMFEQLNLEGASDQEVYNQGCGGGEIFLE